MCLCLFIVPSVRSARDKHELAQYQHAAFYSPPIRERAHLQLAIGVRTDNKVQQQPTLGATKHVGVVVKVVSQLRIEEKVSK